MEALLLDAPVGGWSGGWGTLSDVVAPSPQQAAERRTVEGEVQASPQAATHLLRLSEEFVESDSPQVSPAPHAQKLTRKMKRAKLKALGDASPAQLNRRLKLGTVTRNEVARKRQPCNHCDGEVGPQTTRDTEQAACVPSYQSTQQDQSRELDVQTDEQQEQEQVPQPGQLNQTPSPRSSQINEYIQEEQSQPLPDERLQTLRERPKSAGSIVEFSIPIDSTPWAADSAGAAHFGPDDEQPVGRKQRVRGRAAPRTPSVASEEQQFQLDGCTPPKSGGSPALLASPDSVRNNGSAKTKSRRVASASRTTNLSRPLSRSSTLQSPAALASAAVESALGRLEVERPNSREAVAVAREVRSEMNRWLRNVDPKVTRQQLQARDQSRRPAVQSLQCDPALPQNPSEGWVPYEQRTEGTSKEQQRRSLTPTSYPTLSAARARQREKGTEAFGAALGLKRRTTRSAQSDDRHSVSLPDIGGFARQSQISQAAAEFQRKASRAISVHDRPPWGCPKQPKPKALPARLHRAAAPWGGLSAVPNVGAVMVAMR